MMRQYGCEKVLGGLFLLIVLLTSTVAHTQPQHGQQRTDICGRSSLPPFRSGHHHKIMGGSDAPLGRFPWAVALVRKQDPTQFVCTGTLISPRHVVTAAHCFLDIRTSTAVDKMCGVDPECRLRLMGAEGVDRCSFGPFERKSVGDEFLVLMGSTKLRHQIESVDLPDMFSVSVSSVSWPSYRHFFESGCAVDDMVVLELEREVKNVQFACLPQDVPIDDLRLTEMTAVGWGSDPLKKLQVHPILQQMPAGFVLDSSLCGVHWRQFPFPRDDICVHEQLKQNTCDGDSGGGLFGTAHNRTTLFGVLSFGSQCMELAGAFGSTRTSAYTRLDFQTPFLQRVLKIRNDNFAGFNFSAFAKKWHRSFDRVTLS